MNDYGSRQPGSGVTYQKAPQMSMGPPAILSSASNDGFKMPMAKEPTQNQDNDSRGPKKVFWDEQGRLLDEKGNVVSLKQSAELKINAKQQLKDNNKVKDLLKFNKFNQQSSSTRELLAKRKFYDTTIVSQSNKRDRKKTSAFNFVQEGQFIKRGELLRKKQVLEEYENQQKAGGVKEEVKDEPINLDQTMIDTTSQQEKKKEDSSRIHIRKTVNLKPLDPLPDLEWWDQTILQPNIKEYLGEEQLIKDKLTHYIQHPIPMKNDYVENINKMVVPAHLTQKEKKRLRKIKRVEKEKDKQEKVKLGLLPPPIPKIKLSNYMKVLGKEAIADPSRVEQQVKKIVAKRLDDHLKRNEDNKLTREQKEAKMKRKHDRDLQNNECRVALFKIDSLSEPHIKFKIDMNSQQYHLGGFCFIADQNMAVTQDLPNMILVEGGTRAIKKYKRLMLRRIKWNEKSKKRHNHNAQDGENQDEEMKDEEIPNQEQNQNEENLDNVKESLDRKCFLVWEGIVKKKSFEKWRMVDIRSEGEVKRLLAEKGCEHYWTMVVTYNPERAEGEEPEAIEKVLM